MYNFKAIINNKPIETKNQLAIISPINHETIGTVSSLNKVELDQAFKAAKNAQKNWAETKIDAKITLIRNWKELLLKHIDELATIMTKEIAKSHRDSITEIIRTTQYMEQTIDEFLTLKPLIIDGAQYGFEQKVGTFSRVAKGVGVAISPFNYPVNLAMAKLVPALITGNTIVFKPATQGSLVGIKLIQLAIEAGFKPGIINVVTGKGSEIGDDLVTNKNINFISFTGSVGVGKRILEIASTKDIVLELGGKDPALVLDDYNLDQITSELVEGAFSYSGQRCTAIKRILATNEIADKIVPILKDKISKLSVGAPESNAFITPVIDQKTANYLSMLIDDAKEKGAKIIIGDQREENLIFPTLIDNVSKDMKIAWEEPFGPILPIIRVKDVQTMIEVANESNFGLQASIYTKDMELAYNVAHQLEVGTVNINGKSQRGPDVFPFLGVKDSGFGTQGIKETLLSSTRYKGIVINKAK